MDQVALDLLLKCLFLDSLSTVVKSDEDLLALRKLVGHLSQSHDWLDQVVDDLIRLDDRLRSLFNELLEHRKVFLQHDGTTGQGLLVNEGTPSGGGSLVIFQQVKNLLQVLQLLVEGWLISQLTEVHLFDQLLKHDGTGLHSHLQTAVLGVDIANDLVNLLQAVLLEADVLEHATFVLRLAALLLVLVDVNFGFNSLSAGAAGSNGLAVLLDEVLLGRLSPEILGFDASSW